MLTKPAEKSSPHESPRKRRRRSCKAKKSPVEKSLPESTDQASSIKPRRLEFDEDSEGEQQEDDSGPDSPPYSPAADKSDGADMCDSTPAKSAIPSVDADLFSGKFARPKNSPSHRSSPGTRKKGPMAATAKAPKPAKSASAAPDVPARTEEQREEELMRNDEVRQLLVAILPLDCKPCRACIHVVLGYSTHTYHACFRSDQKFFLQILVQEDLLTVKDAFDNLGTYDGLLVAFRVL